MLVSHPSRRQLLAAAIGVAASAALAPRAFAASFEQWVAGFRPRAIARGVSDATYTRVMGGIKPDTSVYALVRNQDEFNEVFWQYINRRVSDWRIITGKQRAKEYAGLLERLERDYGVDRNILLALWGIESSYGDVIDNPKYMRPVLPALAALAWGEPRRRKYWEAELLNALVIVERGWSTPKEMVGSWAGAMGHTQWMPEVWLHMGVDYDHDGRASPFGAPDDGLAGTARYLVARGKYRRGETWGCEVKLPAGHLVLYPASSLHMVTPITRGVRVASFFWLQSMIRDAHARSLIFDLDTAIQRLVARLGRDDPETVKLTGIYHNLIRYWAEV